MGGDVAPGALMRVAVPEMGQFQRVAERTLGARRIAQPLRVLHEKGEQGYRIGARPFARLPCLIPADGPIAGEPDEGVPASEIDIAFEARRPPAQNAPRSIGKSRVQRTGNQRRIDPVDHLRETRRYQPRHEAGPAREALRPARQALPPLLSSPAGRHIHRSAYDARWSLRQGT